jgi:hypothetical protein
MRKRLNKSQALRDKLQQFKTRAGHLPSNSKLTELLTQPENQDLTVIPDYDPNNKGRPPVIADPRIYNEIVDAVQNGNFLSVAAQLAGVSYDAVVDCLDRGKKGENQLYYKFWLDVRKAEALAESNLVQDIQAQTSLDWRAALELLHRRFPQWAKHDTTTVKHEHSGAVTAKREFSILLTENPVLRQQARDLLKHMGGTTIEAIPE